MNLFPKCKTYLFSIIFQQESLRYESVGKTPVLVSNIHAYIIGKILMLTLAFLVASLCSTDLVV